LPRDTPVESRAKTAPESVLHNAKKRGLFGEPRGNYLFFKLHAEPFKHLPNHQRLFVIAGRECPLVKSRSVAVQTRSSPSANEVPVEFRRLKGVLVCETNQSNKSPCRGHRQLNDLLRSSLLV